MTRQFGLIGFPLSHSFSPAFFNDKFRKERIDAHYSAFPVRDINQLPALLEKESKLCGLNVTIPYKTAVIPYLNFISVSAQDINAVNCIRVKDGKLTGYNTDYTGFLESVRPHLDAGTRKALILGTGGAAKAVIYALRSCGISCTTVSSSGKGDLGYEALTETVMNTHTLLVNTTPLGMYPHVQQYPDIPYHLVTERHVLHDLIYNPEETVFLQKGKERGAATQNGLGMLLRQAELSWDIWNDEATEKLISLQ